MAKDRLQQVVAAEPGFASMSSLSRAFKQRWGANPGLAGECDLTAAALRQDQTSVTDVPCPSAVWMHSSAPTAAARARIEPRPMP